MADKGSGIIAIGNPAIDETMTNELGATVGIVSNPSIDTIGTKRVVCDITVASGSSGGPIFSIDTGGIIGIATAVSKAGLNNTGNISSSGYWCLGAPSYMFDDWLGLTY